MPHVLVAVGGPAVMNSFDMAAKKTPEKQSKSDFIRQQPAEMSAADIVAKAKAEGIKLDATYVYNVRGYDKKVSKKKRAAKKLVNASAPVAVKTATPKAASKATTVTPKTSSASSVEELLKAAAAELGLLRAIELLQGERARVRAVLGG